VTLAWLVVTVLGVVTLGALVFLLLLSVAQAL
jgi:hypothetical protein